MKVTYRQLWTLLLCWQRRYPFGVAVEVSGLSHVTVRRWYRRFRYNLVYESPQLSGTVEVDESFLGRRKTGNQRIAIGAWCRDTRKIVVRRIPNRMQETTDRFLLEHVVRGSIVCTDGAQFYEGIDSFFGYQHVTCNHSEFHFGPTNLAECIWSMLKRFIRRTWHHFRNRHWLPTFLREFEARFNAPELFDSPLTYLQTCLAAVPSRVQYTSGGDTRVRQGLRRCTVSPVCQDQHCQPQRRCVSAGTVRWRRRGEP